MKARWPKYDGFTKHRGNACCISVCTQAASSLRSFLKTRKTFSKSFFQTRPHILLYRTQMCCKFYDKQISSLHACRRRFSHVWSEGNKEVEHKKIPARACVKVHKKFIALVLRMRGTVLIRLRWIFHVFPCSLKSFSRNLAWRRCWGSANF